jgi:hypothetical protein
LHFFTPIYDQYYCILGKSCLEIKEKGLSRGDGMYFIDPDGEGEGEPFEVKCDMTSFGGGWTMCYTTNSHVDIRTELTTTAEHGYRADCNNIPVRSTPSSADKHIKLKVRRFVSEKRERNLLLHTWY